MVPVDRPHRRKGHIWYGFHLSNQCLPFGPAVRFGLTASRGQQRDEEGDDSDLWRRGQMAHSEDLSSNPEAPLPEPGAGTDGRRMSGPELVWPMNREPGFECLVVRPPVNVTI